MPQGPWDRLLLACLLAELDRLDPQLLRQQRLVLPNLPDHRPGCLLLEEELDDLLGLGADDAVEEHAVSISLISGRAAAGRLPPTRSAVDSDSEASVHKSSWLPSLRTFG
jgi:hypothetical protein